MARIFIRFDGSVVGGQSEYSAVSDPGLEGFQQIAQVLLLGFLTTTEQTDNVQDSTGSCEHNFYPTFSNNKPKLLLRVKDEDSGEITINSCMTAAWPVGRWPDTHIGFVYEFSDLSSKEVEKKLFARSSDLMDFLNRVHVVTYSGVVQHTARKIKDTVLPPEWALFQRLDEVDSYGQKLKLAGATAKGNLVRQIADDIKRQAVELFSQRNSITEQQLTDFKTFAHQRLLDEKTHQLLAEHRLCGVTWGVVVGNLLLSLTGIGAVALAIQLIYSKATTGNFLLFGSPDKTTSEQKIEALDLAINEFKVKKI